MINNASSSELLLNMISINFNSLNKFPKSIDVHEYFRYFKIKKNNINDTSFVNKCYLYEKNMLIYFPTYLTYQYSNAIKTFRMRMTQIN